MNNLVVTSPLLQPALPLRQDFVPEGPATARIMLVGDGPLSIQTKERGRWIAPFAGPAGYLLKECLTEAGLPPLSTIFQTAVGREVPPEGRFDNWVAETAADRKSGKYTLADGQWIANCVFAGREMLVREIELVKPQMVVAAGNLALWALTGKWGIRKWRSSIFQGEINGHKFKIIPVHHPSSVLREYPLRNLLVHDLRRVATEFRRGPVVRKPDWQFIVRPTFAQATATLDDLISRLDNAVEDIPLAADIETRAGHTACIGLAWTKLHAICIPFMCVERLDGYWSLEEETALILQLRRILTHRRAKVIWQNGAYDHQYECRWHFFLPKLGWDTMLAHHAIWSISPKSLDHLSSLYCDYHYYWKEDGKHWDPSVPEEQLWTYNCEDCVRTFEIAENQVSTVEYLTPSWPRLPEVQAFQRTIQPVFVKMMNRGVRADARHRDLMAGKLMTAIQRIQGEINDIVGRELNINSSQQMTSFFYEELGLTPVRHRLPNGMMGNPTCDDDALLKIQSRAYLLKPLISRIQALRSAKVFFNTFLAMRVDIDGRYRSSYNVAGTKTYRLSSAENAFGSGGNLQNVPSGDDDEDAIIHLPNIRELFLFDDGMMGFDLDGDSADLRIVTGESGCRQMQAYFAAGVKPYVEIAKEFYRDPTITKHHPSYKRMKALCHGSNYGGEGDGLAERIGLPVEDVERAQAWYFGMCPEIKAWQEDIKDQIVKRGYIENPFGYRLYNWDRPSRKLFNEALAWTPQSTVGILINRIAEKIDVELPWAQLLLQVHDSLTGQFPAWMGDRAKGELKALAESVIIPCRTGPVVVPAGMKTSTVSWGLCS